MELASWEFFAMEFLRIVPRYHLSKFLQAWKKLVVQLFLYVCCVFCNSYIVILHLQLLSK